MNCTYPPITPSNHQPSPTCSAIEQRGVAVPVVGPAADKACPEWRAGIPNLKSSGVLSVDGVLYWAISCFNYGDDEVFNRQRCVAGVLVAMAVVAVVVAVVVVVVVAAVAVRPSAATTAR